MIYLDYNATTPIDKAVLEAMMPYLTAEFGNPSSTYPLGQTAKNAVEAARQQVANLIGAQSKEIFFTGCGSESNNIVIKGVAYSLINKGRHIVTTSIEHPSVLKPLAFLEKNGFEVTYLPPDKSGAVRLEAVEAALRKDTILVTLMHSNNEVGRLQPVAEVGKLCKANGILFHTDASQSVGKVPLDVNDLSADFLTMAGHKFYAPKGIGALFVREGIEVASLVHGASQEKGLRAGTENVPYIAGLGKAAEIAAGHLKQNGLLPLKKLLFETLSAAFADKIHLNGSFEDSLPNTLNISFKGMSGSDILSALPEIYASTGSACHSGQKTISPVLKAMGVEPEIAYGAIRFSVGRFTTKEEIYQTVKLLQSHFDRK